VHACSGLFRKAVCRGRRGFHIPLEGADSRHNRDGIYSAQAVSEFYIDRRISRNQNSNVLIFDRFLRDLPTACRRRSGTYISAQIGLASEGLQASVGGCWEYGGGARQEMSHETVTNCYKRRKPRKNGLFRVHFGQ
jgi:hypothetical protein